MTKTRLWFELKQNTVLDGSIVISTEGEIPQNAPSAKIVISTKGAIQNDSSSNQDWVPPPTSFGMIKTRL
jgi:hypothetical protein